MSQDWPKTVAEAVERILAELSDEQREAFRLMQEQELPRLHFSLGLHIRNQFGLWAGNLELSQDCAARGKSGLLAPYHPDSASTVIIQAAWAALQLGDGRRAER
jgi:hypothetical protein